MANDAKVAGNIGSIGSYSLDIDIKGNVSANLSINKDFGFAKVVESATVTASILDLAEAVAAKTSAKWDDEVVAGIKALLGLTPPVAVAAVAHEVKHE